MSALLSEITCWSLCVAASACQREWCEVVVFSTLLAVALIRCPGVAIEEERAAR